MCYVGEPQKHMLVSAGHIAQGFFARHHMVLQIGSTVFVHGGILPSHADYGLERINRCAQDTLALLVFPASCSAQNHAGFRQ